MISTIRTVHSNFDKWAKEAAWAEYNLRIANEVPLQQEIVNRRWREFQASLKDKYPRKGTGAWVQLEFYIDKRKALEKEIQVHGRSEPYEYDPRMTLGQKLDEFNSLIKKFIIEPNPAEIARREKAWQEAVDKLNELRKPPKF